MSRPDIKIMCVSNVYSRMMHFKNKGDVEIGHTHTFDHGTLVSSGSVLYEVLDGHDGNTLHSREVVAPNFIFVDKDKFHRITALENETICACIHALKTNDGDLLDPDFFIETFVGDGKGKLPKEIKERTGKKWSPAALPPNQNQKIEYV